MLNDTAKPQRQACLSGSSQADKVALGTKTVRLAFKILLSEHLCSLAVYYLFNTLAGSCNITKAIFLGERLTAAWWHLTIVVNLKVVPHQRALLNTGRTQESSPVTSTDL